MRICFLVGLMNLIFLSAVELFAYIPGSKMILEKLVENNTTVRFIMNKKFYSMVMAYQRR